MSEKAVESSVCSWLMFQGYVPLKVGLEGWPDRLVLVGRGMHIWFEFKAPGGKLRAQQSNRIFKLREMGESVHVIESLEQAQDLIAKLRLPSQLSTVGS
jgi:hypothetical protein